MSVMECIGGKKVGNRPNRESVDEHESAKRCSFGDGEDAMDVGPFSPTAHCSDDDDDEAHTVKCSSRSPIAPIPPPGAAVLSSSCQNPDYSMPNDCYSMTADLSDAEHCSVPQRRLQLPCELLFELVNCVRAAHFVTGGWDCARKFTEIGRIGVYLAAKHAKLIGSIMDEREMRRLRAIMIYTADKVAKEGGHWVEDRLRAAERDRPEWRNDNYAFLDAEHSLHGEYQAMLQKFREYLREYRALMAQGNKEDTDGAVTSAIKDRSCVGCGKTADRFWMKADDAGGQWCNACRKQVKKIKKAKKTKKEKTVKGGKRKREQQEQETDDVEPVQKVIATENVDFSSASARGIGDRSTMGTVVSAQTAAEHSGIRDERGHLNLPPIRFSSSTGDVAPPPPNSGAAGGGPQ